MVLADMKLAAETPTDAILFNIDSKSDTNGKQDKDAIVKVFLKVFNEMQEFCGSMPYLADLERRLTEEGRLKNLSIPLKKNMGMHGKIPDRILTLFRILWWLYWRIWAL